MHLVPSSIPQLSTLIISTFPKDYARGSVWWSPSTRAPINSHTHHAKGYFTPANVEPCVKLGQNFSAVVVPPKCSTASVFTRASPASGFGFFSPGEEMHCFPTVRAHSLFHSRIIFQGCSSFSYFTIFDCTSRALASSPSSCLAKAFELWAGISNVWN